MSSELNKTGVYFLIKDGKIIYIGKTTQFEVRIKAHRAKGMCFDYARLIQCDKSRISFYEARWIKKFKPLKNIKLKTIPDLRAAVTQDDIINGFDTDKLVKPSTYAKLTTQSREMVYRMITQSKLGLVEISGVKFLKIR